MNIRNEIKAIIVREGVTMSEVVQRLATRHDWSASVPNFSDKLKHGTLRYTEALDLAEVLGYEIIWQRKINAAEGSYPPARAKHGAAAESRQKEAK